MMIILIFDMVILSLASLIVEDTVSLLSHCLGLTRTSFYIFFINASGLSGCSRKKSLLWYCDVTQGVWGKAGWYLFRYDVLVAKLVDASFHVHCAGQRQARVVQGEFRNVPPA
ncbi:hypothetical protein K469DRAFT_700598 [Zopfia rhizophila CBS 207.26]|uniref:Secreted protein n=1 Tax=Zopfia rhizophila CBS 207.26 TaxID=1314779 RepID=A0A6A6EEE5_9PEZI|nr:hypothetical protein K469DRAFT_700598 [Zopfia rhizophila CBS 207.26]